MSELTITIIISSFIMIYFVYIVYLIAISPTRHEIIMKHEWEFPKDKLPRQIISYNDEIEQKQSQPLLIMLREYKYPILKGKYRFDEFYDECDNKINKNNILVWAYEIK